MRSLFILAILAVMVWLSSPTAADAPPTTQPADSTRPAATAPAHGENLLLGLRWVAASVKASMALQHADALGLTEAQRTTISKALKVCMDTTSAAPFDKRPAVIAREFPKLDRVLDGLLSPEQKIMLAPWLPLPADIAARLDGILKDLKLTAAEQAAVDECRRRYTKRDSAKPAGPGGAFHDLLADIKAALSEEHGRQFEEAIYARPAKPGPGPATRPAK